MDPLCVADFTSLHLRMLSAICHQADYYPHRASLGCDVARALKRMPKFGLTFDKTANHHPGTRAVVCRWGQWAVAVACLPQHSPSNFSLAWCRRRRRLRLLHNQCNSNRDYISAAEDSGLFTYDDGQPRPHARTHASTPRRDCVSLSQTF